MGSSLLHAWTFAGSSADRGALHKSSVRNTGYRQVISVGISSISSISNSSTGVVS
jgi:hypothetical protein